MTTTPTIYNILKSVEGNELGLDNTESSSPSLGTYAPYLMGAHLQGLRLFPAGKFGVQGNDYKIGPISKHKEVFDDFMGYAVSDILWHQLTGSDGSCAVALHAADNGTLRLTSGAGSTHTMAVNGAQNVGGLNNLVSDGSLRFETRLGAMSALTSQNVVFGLIDAVTLTAPFTISGTTITANGTNGAAFVVDSAATGAAANLNCVAVNAGGTAQSVNLGTTTLSTTGFHVYRIEIDTSGNATFFIDGVLVATITAAVATTAKLAPSVGLFSNATSASQTLDVDYMLTQSARV